MTVLIVVLVWVAASVLFAVGFALGGAAGYRRGIEDALDATDRCGEDQVVALPDLGQVRR